MSRLPEQLDANQEVTQQSLIHCKRLGNQRTNRPLVNFPIFPAPPQKQSIPKSPQRPPKRQTLAFPSSPNQKNHPLLSKNGEKSLNSPKNRKKRKKACAHGCFLIFLLSVNSRLAVDFVKTGSPSLKYHSLMHCFGRADRLALLPRQTGRVLRVSPLDGC